MDKDRILFTREECDPKCGSTALFPTESLQVVFRDAISMDEGVHFPFSELFLWMNLHSANVSV